MIVLAGPGIPRTRLSEPDSLVGTRQETVKIRQKMSETAKMRDFTLE